MLGEGDSDDEDDFKPGRLQRKPGGGPPGQSMAARAQPKKSNLFGDDSDDDEDIRPSATPKPMAK